MAATTKSSEIYRSPNRKNTASAAATAAAANERYQRAAINSNSGPSSYDSIKTSNTAVSSGPSSIESGKTIYSNASNHRLSDHSNLELTSTNGHYLSTSPNRMSFSSSPKHYVVTKSKLANDNLNRVKSTSTNSSPIRRKPSTTAADSTLLGKPPTRPSINGGNISPPSSSTNNSNSSITLQVTTSNESHIPSTKIYVQNSPVRSVITLENGKLTENSNVVIINNETTTNANGELIKRTITKQGSPTRVVTMWDKELQQNSSYSETEAAYETGDSMSLISETSPDSSICMMASTVDGIETNKFNKNINNDATMNNSRKLSLQIGHPANNIVYKNCLKDSSTTDANSTCTATTSSSGGGGGLTSTTTSSATSLLLTPQSPAKGKNNYFDPAPPSSVHQHNQTNESYDRIAGSVGNLRFFEKNEKKLYSNCDLNQLQQFETPALLAKLNSNPAINTVDSLAHMLHKNIITVGSEPNLAMKMNECVKQQNNGGGGLTVGGISNAGDHKSIDKEPMDRRFSVSTTCNNGGGGIDEIYNFPSLTDLSFNFTSLAAQKILQGVSINSIDTLVELNMAQQEKQQNLVTAASAAGTTQPIQPAIRTDYGMV